MDQVFRLLSLFLSVSAPWSLAPAATGQGLPAGCPPGCYCDERESALRINCHPLASGPEESFQEVAASLPEGTTHLDLARYGLREVPEGFLDGAPDMVKLDLQNNEISHVDEGAFASLRRLEVLDLSRNRLEAVTTGMLEGLANLSRLKLNDNRIQTIESGAFDHLGSLSRLEMSDNPFICDCNLAWLVEWLEVHSGRVALANGAKTRCALPIALADVPLRKADPDSMVCGDGSGSASAPALWPGGELVDSPLAIRLRPKEDQVVFEGDSSSLTCSVEVRDGASPASVKVGIPSFSQNDVLLS